MDRGAELLTRYFGSNDRLMRRLASLHAVVSWTPFLLYGLGLASVPAALISIAVAVPCHALAVKLLRGNRVV